MSALSEATLLTPIVRHHTKFFRCLSYYSVSLSKSGPFICGCICGLYATRHGVQESRNVLNGPMASLSVHVPLLRNIESVNDDQQKWPYLA